MIEYIGRIIGAAVCFAISLIFGMITLAEIISIADGQSTILFTAIFGLVGLLFFALGFACMVPGKHRKQRKAQKKWAKQQAIKNRDYAKQQAGDSRCLEIAMVELRNILQDYALTLGVKRRQKIFRDDYGRVVKDKWEKEMQYFLREIAMPKLEGRIPTNVLERAEHAAQHNAEARYGLDSDTLSGIAAFELLAMVEVDAIAIEQDRADVERDAVSALRDPADFERHCAAELLKAGWDARVCAGSGDQGVDVVATTHDFTLVLQCKLYSSALGNTPVQEIYAGAKFYNADLAAVVTNSDYTPGARTAAAQTNVVLLHESELSQFDPSQATKIAQSFGVSNE